MKARAQFVHRKKYNASVKLPPIPAMKIFRFGFSLCIRTQKKIYDIQLWMDNNKDGKKTVGEQNNNKKCIFSALYSNYSIRM